MKLNEVTQRMLEAYEGALLKKGEEVRSAAQYNRIVIEAAQEAGIADGLPDDFGDLKPYQVSGWSAEILKHVTASRQPPAAGE